MTSPTGPARRLIRWESGSEWPLAAVAALFLAAYAWPILDVGLPHTWKVLCTTVQYTAWAIFVVDYVMRLGLAERRMRYFSRHLLDLAIVALPLLRPLRLLRLLILLKVLNRRAADSLRGRIAIYVVGATSLLLFCASLAVLEAERRRHGANITTFGDAMWWSVSTITAVGYGDDYPTTPEGRFIAVGLMVDGVALLGVVTATIASWVIDRVREEEESIQAATRADVRVLHAEIVELKSMVADLVRLGPQAEPHGQT